MTETPRALVHRRHCMVVHNYFPLGEPRVQRQAQALVEAGIQVDVICLRNRDEEAASLQDGLRIIRLPVRRDKERGVLAQFLEYLHFFALAMVRLARLHFQRHYQVVQVHNLPDFLVFAALIPRLFGATIILDLHDLMPEFYSARFGVGMDAWPVRLVRWQERLSCLFAHRVFTVTSLWRQALIDRGVPAEKVGVVMNVADANLFFQRSRPSADRGEFKLVYHGNLTYRYGIDLVLQAVASLRSQIPECRLLIHGRGDYLAALQALTVEHGLQDVVEFSTGLIAMAELPALLRSADVGLVPYRRDIFTDGILPTKLMEYTALGLPAIVARTPVIEAYFDPDMVVYFEPGDVQGLARSILDLYQHPQRRVDVAQQVQRFNSQYSWAKQKNHYITEVKKALASRKPGQVMIPQELDREA